MARIAGLSEAQLRVVGIGRALVILQVARHTCRGAEVVVIVGVTVGTLTRRHGMHAREHKSRH